MVTINVAYTAPVNSASAPSKLTPSQLWTALERKSRHGQDFVPAIASTEVIEELSSTRLKRKVVFKPLDGMPGSVVEDVTAYKPSRVSDTSENCRERAMRICVDVSDRLSSGRTLERWSTILFQRPAPRETSSLRTRLSGFILNSVRGPQSFKSCWSRIGRWQRWPWRRRSMWLGRWLPMANWDHKKALLHTSSHDIRTEIRSWSAVRSCTAPERHHYKRLPVLSCSI